MQNKPKDEQAEWSRRFLDRVRQSAELHKAMKQQSLSPAKPPPLKPGTSSVK